jgi:FkbM family methyltransferase
MNLVERTARKILSLLYLPFRYANVSYSQEGEDRVLLTLFEDFPKDYRGFYVDIGAHHPWRFSNTFLFYKMGWSGINIDATPGSMESFRRHRRRDINLELGIGPTAGEITFYCFNEPALNTFDEKIAQSRDGQQGYHVIAKKSVLVMTLEAVLDKHLPEGKKIDFLSIDVEGLDLMVLKSNNWNKYRPLYLLVEEPLHSSAAGNATLAYVSQFGYQMVSRTQRTVILKRFDP